MRRLKENPQQALQHLQQAANRFREAVRVRPDSTESRHNLEIVSQRILELTDSLAKKDPARPEQPTGRVDPAVARPPD